MIFFSISLLYISYKLRWISISIFFVLYNTESPQETEFAMNLQKCLSLREIIQSLNSAINNTDHDTQTHFRIWNDFRIIFIFFLYRGRTPAFIFDTEKRTQVRVSQWEGHRSVK